jgi:hypothetical protein
MDDYFRIMVQKAMVRPALHARQLLSSRAPGQAPTLRRAGAGTQMNPNHDDDEQHSPRAAHAQSPADAGFRSSSAAAPASQRSTRQPTAVTRPTAAPTASTPPTVALSSAAGTWGEQGRGGSQWS